MHYAVLLTAAVILKCGGFRMSARMEKMVCTLQDALLSYSTLTLGNTYRTLAVRLTLHLRVHLLYNYRTLTVHLLYNYWTLTGHIILHLLYN
jgi:hypothetical protein